MEKTIRNNEELRDAYFMVFALTEFIEEAKKTEKCRQSIIDYKRAIRQYNKHRCNQKYLWGDYDSYVMLIEFPSWMDIETAKAEFEENYRLHYYPSQYDCTGQHFTTGTKFVVRHGRVYCYHSISVDV